MQCALRVRRARGTLDNPNRKRAGGFTMIEVLVALAIIAVALAASLRAVGSLATGAAPLLRRLRTAEEAGVAHARSHRAPA